MFDQDNIYNLEKRFKKPYFDDINHDEERSSIDIVTQHYKKRLGEVRVVRRNQRLRDSVTRFFASGFFMNQFPPSPVRAVSIIFENSQRYSQLKVCR
jgi:hypothetical protein